MRECDRTGANSGAWNPNSQQRGKADAYPSSAKAGGNAYAEVVSEAQNADGIVRKHLGPPRFEPIKLACGVGMSPGFYDWLSQMVERRGAPKSGEIVTIEASGRETK